MLTSVVLSQYTTDNKKCKTIYTTFTKWTLLDYISRYWLHQNSVLSLFLAERLYKIKQTYYLTLQAATQPLSVVITSQLFSRYVISVWYKTVTFHDCQLDTPHHRFNSTKTPCKVTPKTFREQSLYRETGRRRTTYKSFCHNTHII